MKIFGREPVYITGFVVVFLQLLAAFGVKVDAERQTLIVAALSAGFAVVTAVVLKNGAVGATILQLAQAGLALFVGYGLDWSASKQGAVLAMVAAGVVIWTREKVVAPVPQLPVETRSPLDKASAPHGV